MYLYQGRLVFDIVTAVGEKSEEAAMKNDAHENLTNELFKELQAFIEAKGYQVLSIGVDLENCGKADQAQLKALEESEKDGNAKVKRIYNKANITSHTIQIIE
ncbi:hypothetical protein I6G82_22930 [Lysinibacillus macroides]|uniref:Uncharacterized protein n=1 Tax=Lysinibacillus macroides TaxID=33935 RepID=A0A0M9DJV4_9BACI|nr:hypothetical protein [Lysinibacillus macroides]KOY81880.1 hypothetical protein ADM90_13295 [Lysinibacillus macroides]QPR67989.1 hypothetical protein I6G82_22930 [Lysinibacillus macroides]